MPYFLTGLMVAAFLFGAYIITFWSGIIEMRIALAGIYFVLGAVAAIGVSILLQVTFVLDRMGNDNNQ